MLTHSQQRPVTSALVEWALKLPINTDQPDRYDLCGLARDLLNQALKNVGSNNVVIPVLQTYTVLLEADVFENLPGNPQGFETYVIHDHTRSDADSSYRQDCARFCRW